MVSRKQWLEMVRAHVGALRSFIQNVPPFEDPRSRRNTPYDPMASGVRPTDPRFKTAHLAVPIARFEEALAANDVDDLKLLLLACWERAYLGGGEYRKQYGYVECATVVNSFPQED